MSNEKNKPDSGSKPLRESVDFGEVAPCKDRRTLDTGVSNTLPAPPNPNRSEQGSDKKGQ